MVISFIRKQVREAGETAFDVLPATFLSSLRVEYEQYCRVNDIAKFSFSSHFGKDRLSSLRLEGVEVIYGDFQLDRRHWVGLVIDLGKWSVTVLDCNTVVVSDEKMEANLQPILHLFPYLLQLNGFQAKMEDGNVPPLSVTRIEPPMLSEQTGMHFYTIRFLL